MAPLTAFSDPSTRDAVAAYQIANQLNVTRSLSPDTLESLGLPQPAPTWANCVIASKSKSKYRHQNISIKKREAGSRDCPRGISRSTESRPRTALHAYETGPS